MFSRWQFQGGWTGLGVVPLLLLVFLPVPLVSALAPPAWAREAAPGGAPLIDAAPMAGDWRLDLPVVGSQGGTRIDNRTDPRAETKSGTRSDTIGFGFYDAQTGFAVQGETWTFDHGAPDSLEGWRGYDLSLASYADPPVVHWHRIDAAAWSGHGNQVSAPILSGAASAWVGAFEDQADSLCWEGGLGYGNRWEQRYASPELTYSGSGTVTLSFKYFNDSEEEYDYSKVLLILLPDSTVRVLNSPGFSDRIGDPSSGSYPTYTRVIQQSEFQDHTQFRVAFEFTSDGGWSDQDGYYTTAYGPLGVDDVALTGNLVGGDRLFDFEQGDEGFVASIPGLWGTYFGLGNWDDYQIPDPCGCGLSGKVAMFHNSAGEHPTYQYERIISPPVDRGSLGAFYNKVFAEYDTYVDLPLAHAVYYRTGWSYFPWICPVTGEAMWSPALMSSTFFIEQYGCLHPRSDAAEVGVPEDAQYVRLIYDMYRECWPDLPCDGESNFSPLLDNFQIRVTHQPAAPTLSFESGKQFQDGFGQGVTNSPSVPGNADITYNLHRGTGLPDLLGDSLVVTGPLPTASTRWEARFWWRLRREGPQQSGIPGYNAWKDAVSDGLNIVGAQGQFTFGWMDSVQLGSLVAKNRFISEFRESDDDYAGEWTDNNEMIRDRILAPGTQIEYFATSNYTCTPAELYYLPDTTGGAYVEFEILPSYRRVDSVDKYPCVLYVDAENRGAQFYIEHALDAVFNGAGPLDPIPNPAFWDRYDYLDASSNWKAPLFRNTGGNAGATVPQLLGYKLILVNTGGAGVGTMEQRDWEGFAGWLRESACCGNVNRQGFLGSGDNLAGIINATYPQFLNDHLGTTFVCDAYNQAGCGPTPADEQVCVRLEGTGAGGWMPVSELDLFGNACPQSAPFDRLGVSTGGFGNKVYKQTPDGPLTEYAEVTRAEAEPGNYRVGLSGYTPTHLMTRVGGDPQTECVGDAIRTLTALSEEMREAVRWMFQISSPDTLGLVYPDPCVPGSCGTGVRDGSPAGPAEVVNRLEGNYPNPFNPRTVIRFSLARAGAAELVLYDVNGRRVRNLVAEDLAAGPHQVAWDGRDDRGQKLGRGVYWSQLRAGDYRSSMKMILLE